MYISIDNSLSSALIEFKITCHTTEYMYEWNEQI